MAEAIRSWVIGIAAMSLITSVVMAMVPKGKVRRTVSLVCSVAMIVVLIGPIISFDFDALAGYMADYTYNAETNEKNLDEENERLLRNIIHQEVNAYILDKAKALGATDIEVETETKMDEEGEWYPWEVSITGSITLEQRSQLENLIEADIGVPAERQYWSTNDE